MKLLKLFRKSRYNKNTNELVSLNSNFVMPKRKDFKDRKDVIKLIDYYKKKYLEILTSKKTITSKDLELGSYYDEIRMYTFLVNRTCSDEEKKTNEELLVASTRLLYYKYGLMDLELENTARLIALEELRYHRVSLFKNRNAVLEELGHLVNNRVIFKQVLVGLEHEITTFRIRRDISNLQSDEEKLKEEFVRITTLAAPVINIKEKDNEHLVSKVARLQVALEKYAILNKDELHKINALLDEIESTKKTEENRQELYYRMNTIQNKFMIFFEFGDGTISDKDVKRFYSIKLDVITPCYDNINTWLHLNEDDYEQYKKLLPEKIEDIRTGKNPFLNEAFGNDVTQVSNLFMRLMKKYNKAGYADTRELDIHKILQVEGSIQFIQAFDNNDRMEYFLKNTYFSPDIYDFFSDGVISFTSKVTYDCVATFSKVGILLFDEIATIGKLYKYHVEEKNVYYIPNGVRIIKHCNYISATSFEKTKIRTLRRNAKNKIVVLPDNLRFMDCAVLGDDKPLAIVLNKNCEVFISTGVFTGESELVRECNGIIILPYYYRDRDLEEIYESILSGEFKASESLPLAKIKK